MSLRTSYDFTPAVIKRAPKVYEFGKYSPSQARGYFNKRSKRFTRAMRDIAEAKGHTMPGGGFPIEYTADLARAKHAFGRAKDKAAARAWINHRAKDLGEAPLGGDIGKCLAKVELMKSKEPLKDGVVWGWASIIKDANGVVTDHDGDQISETELVKAAHDFVSNSRTGGALHIMAPGTKTPLRAGEVVESLVLTSDLQKALGIDLGKVGWLVGYKITDPIVRKAYEDGQLPSFSMGGAGVREPING